LFIGSGALADEEFLNWVLKKVLACHWEQRSQVARFRIQDSGFKSQESGNSYRGTSGRHYLESVAIRKSAAS
jgi:hypothetical protein